MPVTGSPEKNTQRNVVIVDDQNLFAEGFARILEGIPGVSVESIIRDGNDVKEYLEVLQPDVLFLDLNLPGRNGLDVLRSIRDEHPRMIIAILTVYEDQLLINRVREYNANAFLSKDASVEDLEKVIFSTSKDPFFISTSLKNNQSSGSTEIFNDSFSIVGLLTTREKEIISLLVQGKSTESISRELYISFNTVKTHKKNIFSKLNLNKVPELVRFAYENNLV